MIHKFKQANDSSIYNAGTNFFFCINLSDSNMVVLKHSIEVLYYPSNVVISNLFELLTTFNNRKFTLLNNLNHNWRSPAIKILRLIFFYTVRIWV